MIFIFVREKKKQWKEDRTLSLTRIKSNRVKSQLFLILTKIMTTNSPVTDINFKQSKFKKKRRKNNIHISSRMKRTNSLTCQKVGIRSESLTIIHHIIYIHTHMVKITNDLFK